MTLTPDRLKRINARADRQKYKDSGGETGKLSLFIRIGTSTLYDWEPAVRAVLKEIAFMTVQGEGDLMKPTAECRKDIPYDGWCWASEKYLAERVGCSERWVREAVRRFGKDGLMQFRGWRDKFGHLHQEYHILEETVDAAQRDKELPRPKCTPKARKPNAGTFSSTTQPVHKRSKATGSSAREPQEVVPVSYRNCSPLAIGTVAREPQEVTAVEGVDVAVGVGVELGRNGVRTPASRGQEVSSLRSDSKPTPKPKATPPVAPPARFQIELTPGTTCADCHGYYLDCLHKAGTVANPKVKAIAAKAAFETEEDLLSSTR